MMNVVWAVLACAAVWAIYRLLEDYTRRSLRSYASAERVWADLNSTARSLLERDIGVHLAHNILSLSIAAGCGCFVRGLLIQHYLPAFITNRKRSNSEVENGFREAESLTGEAKQEFNQLLALVMLYDSFRNPFQGWLFKRVLSSYARRPSFRELREAELASYSVLSRKNLAGHFA